MILNLFLMFDEFMEIKRIALTQKGVRLAGDAF